jgi:hypothetical protein
LAAEDFQVAVFATAGGGGEAADMCFFCPAFMIILATVAVGVIGAARGSVGAAVIAAMLAGFTGVVVLYAAATLEPSDDPDEQGNQQLMRSTVGWWATSAVIAVGSVGWVAVRRHRRLPCCASGLEVHL